MNRARYVVQLHDGWTVTPTSPDSRVEAPVQATVPGCVHTDLIAAGLVPDPYLDRNEIDLAWVADLDWTYRTQFHMVQAPAGATVELVAEGLDTLATIELNGERVASTENMHRTYRFDVTTRVRDGANELVITFASARREAERRRQVFGEWPSSSFGEPFNYIRKMACSWGWDWGPTLTTAGIWRPIRLEITPVARLCSVRPSVGFTDRRGVVATSITVEGASDVFTVVGRVSTLSGSVVASDEVTVVSGIASISLNAGVVQPWWPHTMGDPTCYRLDVELHDAAGEVVDTWSRAIGFRDVRLDTRPDDLGSAFTFVVNGQPMFVRGANWIPHDTFPARVGREQLQPRLQQAVAANVDLLRVWGGGVYESEAFYELCDELGLLVWQDFTFACAAYPEELLADEVAAEARDNVERLMPHPSLALWCGNNENIWGYFDWGWQAVLEGRSWGAGFYLELFPTVVAEIDPSRPYWPGSPYSGSMTIAPNADANGCTHVWDVWNEIDLDRYRDKTPRFVSEFGWQAPPTWPTIKASISDDPLTPISSGMLHHQKATDGQLKLNRGIGARFRASLLEDEPFELWWWAAQLIQARAVTTGIEHFRSLRPLCMGTIWWQLNDCWPVTSWALIDGFGRRKPAWYALRAAYRPRLLTLQPRGCAVQVVAVNDSRGKWKVEGVARRLRFDGTELARQKIGLDVHGLSAARVELSDAVATPDDPSSELIVVDAGDDRAWWWFVDDPTLRLPATDVSLRPTRIGPEQWVVDITATTLVRDLALLADRAHPDAVVDQQLLNMLPGESTSVRITGAPTLDCNDRSWVFTANDLG